MEPIVYGFPGALAFFVAFNVSASSVRSRTVGAVVLGVLTAAVVAAAVASDGGHSSERSAAEIRDAGLAATVAFVAAIEALYGLGLFVGRLVDDARRPVQVVVAWIGACAAAVMFLFATFVIGIMYAAKANCAPDAYECPL